MVIKQYSGSDGTSINIQGYAEFLEKLKNRVATSRLRAARAVNTELTTLYHYIGTEILDRQKRYGWGSKVIDNLSQDLHSAFPYSLAQSLQNNAILNGKIIDQYKNPVLLLLSDTVVLQMQTLHPILIKTFLHVLLILFLLLAHVLHYLYSKNQKYI